METNNKGNQNQGKQSTAKTDETYNRDAEKLKNSATTSQNSGTSPTNLGTGGILRQDDQGNPDTGDTNPKEG